jgi:hypothetical protein
LGISRRLIIDTNFSLAIFHQHKHINLHINHNHGNTFYSSKETITNMDLGKKIKFWIVGLIGLAIIAIIILAIFSFFMLLLPIAIVLFVIGILLSILRRKRSPSIIIKTMPEKSNKETIDVNYKIKESKE